MSKKTVGDLIEMLEPLPKDRIVELGVYWDNCLHIQNFNYVECTDGVSWVILVGNKHEFKE